jgi:hypothetical protein
MSAQVCTPVTVVQFHTDNAFVLSRFQTKNKMCVICSGFTIYNMFFRTTFYNIFFNSKKVEMEKVAA